MTLDELIKQAYHIKNIHPSRYDWRVVIPTEDPSMGGRRRVEVKGINSGFDWEFGDVIITPSEPLIVKPKYTIDEFIGKIENKHWERIRGSSSDAECRRILKELKIELDE